MSEGSQVVRSLEVDDRVASAGGSGVEVAPRTGVSGNRIAGRAQRVTGRLRDGTQFVGMTRNLRCRAVDGVITLGGTISGTGLAVDVQPFRTALDLDQIDIDRPRTTLTLDIGRLYPDFAGSVVELDPVQIDVTAVPERSQLLGNLLSWLADLLDAEDQPQGTSALLNRILSWSGLSR